MSEPTETTSAALRLNSVAAARLLVAIESPEPTPTDQSANTRANRDLPDGYIAERLLGSGGGGRVYRAFRDGSDRPLALKILDYRLGPGPNGLAGSPAAQRAWRELQLLQDLHLPVLPRLIDYGSLPDGRLYIATEFIEGDTLDALTPPPSGRGAGGGTLGPSETPGFAGLSPASQETLALLLAKVCDAVQILHEHGILHRDLKPSNILIDTHGEPMLIDLGIATIMDPSSTPPPQPGGGRGSGASRGGGTLSVPESASPAFPTLTETGSPIGTPAFMAPEQARGERRRISTRSDVYSLGATAYKILTGSTPHDTNTTIHEAIRRVAFDEPRDPRTLEPTLSKPLAAVLSKACARAPERRYASAAGLAADLRRWANGEPVYAQPPTRWQRAARWAARHPITTTIAACAAIAMVSLGAMATALWWYNTVPLKVDRYVEAREYRLVTRSGVSLKEWRDTSVAGEEERFVAQRVDVPARNGDGWFVVSVDPDSMDAMVGPRQLAVWNPYSLEKPLWHTSPASVALPAFAEADESDYCISIVRIADVFPDLPGEEIIAVHQRAVAPSVIRVYAAANGDVLFEAWHHGWVAGAFWLKNPRLIVLSAMDNTHPWKHGDAQYHSMYPYAVFALRPTLHGGCGLLNGPRADLQAKSILAWYKYLTPPAFVAERGLRLRLDRPLRQSHAGTRVILSVCDPERPCGVQMYLDAAGRVVHRDEVNRWSDQHGDHPPEHFDLRDDLDVESSQESGSRSRLP